MYRNKSNIETKKLSSNFKHLNNLTFAIIIEVRIHNMRITANDKS